MREHRSAAQAAALEDQARRAARAITPEQHREHSSSPARSGVSGPLPAATLSLMQRQFAHDFSDVRVHSGNDAARSAAAMSARAFTSGSDVFFAAGEYRPHTAAGQRLIAHELTHVLQQRASPAAPAIQCDAEKGEKDKPDGGSGAAKAKSWKGAAAKCGPDFCTPFATEKEAVDDRDGFFGWSAIRIGVGAAVNTRVLPVWDTWAAGGVATVQNFTKQFGADFASSSTTASTTKTLLDALKVKLAATPPAVPKGGAVTLDIPSVIPLEAAGVDVEGSSTELNFNAPNEVPGNLAGGIGKDQKKNRFGAHPSPQDDQRTVKGSVLISDAGSAFTATPSLSYTVKDTVDLCPGDCGGPAEKIATVPMSRWEATRISGDVPYEVEFAPLSLSSFTLPKPVPAAPAPKTTPEPPASKEEPKKGPKEKER
jgi:hypothetical protein